MTSDSDSGTHQSMPPLGTDSVTSGDWPLNQILAYSDVDARLRKVIRLEKWNSSTADSNSAGRDVDNEANAVPTREVSLLWRLGGHGNLFDYAMRNRQPGKFCIS